MSMRADDLYLVDIVEAAEAMARILSKCDFSAFVQDDVIRSAVLWKLYTVSEASVKLSPGMRDRFVSIPWDRIRGFRNRMAHGYFTLKWDDVWAIASQYVPLMRSQSEAILAADFPQVFRELNARRASGPPD